MAVVVGTAGHIDHGKTTLLRALTGIDADRLPEEQRRGMTIDVGYAHLDVLDGEPIDFVDVPGHDRLVGNMLVGAGEIDAALLVIAADDGPRPQTLEHLELLDALGVADVIVAVTKADLVDEVALVERLAEARALVGRTRLAVASVVAVSAASGSGLAELRGELRLLASRLAGETGSSGPPAGRPRLAIDRAFAVRGRGTVVTGTLRGGSIGRQTVLRLEPGGREVRVREVQVHGHPVRDPVRSGRVALNLVGVDLADLRRGLVAATPGAVVPTRRLLVALEPSLDLRSGERRALPGHGERLRLHLGTEQAEALVVRNARSSADLPDGGATAVLRLDRPVAAAFGDRFVLRRPSPGLAAAGGRIVDPLPPLGVSRRRATAAGLASAAAARGSAATVTALVALHGAVPAARVAAMLEGGASPAEAPDTVRSLGPLLVDASVAAATEATALGAVRDQAGAEPLAGGLQLAVLRPLAARDLRRSATLDPPSAFAAATALVDGLVARGALVAAGDRVRLPGQAATLPPEVLAAMDRVEAALSVAAPPPLSDVVRAAGCPPEGVRALEAADRIVRLEPEIAYARPMYAQLAGLALRMAAAGPLAPAAFRDATGTSRKYALAILEDLDRRGLLARTPSGHVPGPRAPGEAQRAS